MAAFSISQHGATLGQLIGIAGALSSPAGPAPGSGRPDQPGTPCILHWNLNHFVVLKSDPPRPVIHDPASGLRRVSLTRPARLHRRGAGDSWPSADFPSAPPPAIRFRDLIGRVEGSLGAGVQVLALAVALEIFAWSALYPQWDRPRAGVGGSRPAHRAGAGLPGRCSSFRRSRRRVRDPPPHIGTNLSPQWRTNVFAHLGAAAGVVLSAATSATSCRAFGGGGRFSPSSPRPFSALIDGLMSAVTLARCSSTARRRPGWRWGRWSPTADPRDVVPARCASPPSRRSSITPASSRTSSRRVRGIQADWLLFPSARTSGVRWLGLVAEQVNAGVRTQRLSIAFRPPTAAFRAGGIAIPWMGAGWRSSGDDRWRADGLQGPYKDQFDNRVARAGGKYFELRMLRLQGERLADIVLTKPESAQSWPCRHRHRCRCRRSAFRACASATPRPDPWVVDGIDLTRSRPGQSVALRGPVGLWQDHAHQPDPRRVSARRGRRDDRRRQPAAQRRRGDAPAWWAR